MLSTQELFDGRYKILAELGHGGMGYVYKAMQPDLDRVVAIKVLSAHKISGDARGRFEREAVAMSSIKHPGVASIFGYGVSPQGMPYLVLEFVDGVSLDAELADKKPLDVQRTLSIMKQLCDAIAFAHAAGIVHRDLKPGNIMLTKNGDTEVVKIIDLGLARFLPESGKEHQKLTETGTALGSVLYMSPEQCNGAPADVRGDVYALGVILHQCLTGKVPYDAETAVAALVALNGSAPPALKDVHPQADIPGLQSVIYKALAKDPGERYQSVNDMLEDIETVKSGNGQALTGPVQLKRKVEGRPQKVRAFKRPSQAGLIGIALAIIIGLSAFLYVTYFATNSERLYMEVSKELAVAESAAAAGANERSDSFSRFYEPSRNEMHVDPRCGKFISQETMARIQRCLELNERDHMLDQIDGAKNKLSAIELCYYVQHGDARATALLEALLNSGKLLSTSDRFMLKGSFLSTLIRSMSDGSKDEAPWRILLKPFQERASSMKRQQSYYLLGSIATFAPSTMANEMAAALLQLNVGAPYDNLEVIDGTIRTMKALEKSDPATADRLCKMGVALKKRAPSYAAGYWIGDIALHHAWKREWSQLIECTDNIPPTRDTCIVDMMPYAMRLYALEMLGRHGEALELLKSLEAFDGGNCGNTYGLYSAGSAFRAHGDIKNGKRVFALVEKLEEQARTAYASGHPEYRHQLLQSRARRQQKPSPQRRELMPETPTRQETQSKSQQPTIEDVVPLEKVNHTNSPPPAHT